MMLDPVHCYEAIRARDSRFDGQFFVGVSTTGVYCRPVCAVRTPGRDRCSYYLSAAAAEAAGYRPCLRCRPELAPGRAPVDRVQQQARQAVARIEAGALDEGSFDALAAELSLSARQLRRSIEREYGVPPVALAQTRRLLLAKQLLTDTDLCIAEVAFASGFSSVRRFNDLFRRRYRLQPRALRARRKAGESSGLVLQLGFRPPLAWPALGGFLAGRGASAVEQFDGRVYRRTVRIDGHSGWISAAPAGQRPLLRVELSAGLLPVLTPLLARLRRLFDLDADPLRIAEHLGRDARLAGPVAACPGLRIPGTIDGFDIALRAVLGQQISVKAATTVYSRCVAAFGTPVETPFAGLDRLAPDAGTLAQASVADLQALGIMRARAQTIRGLARAVADGRVRLDGSNAASDAVASLVELPGIGPWTAHYVAMRALGDPDVFPRADLGLLKALGLRKAAELEAASQPWRPWRAYAAIHLWHALGAGG